MVESAHQQFETFMRAHAVPEALGEPNGLSFGWFGVVSVRIGTLMCETTSCSRKRLDHSNAP
jgi:hypothetical protein